MMTRGFIFKKVGLGMAFVGLRISQEPMKVKGISEFTECYSRYFAV